MTSPHVVHIPNKSTNGRISLRLLRLELRVLGALAPRLADARAAALFATPRGPRRPAEPGAPGLPVERFTVRSGAVRLAAWAWGRGPTVLLVHGWNGHAAQLQSFISPLVLAGFRVVAYDQPAHGRSTGRRTTVVQMAEAAKAVARAVGPLHAVVAHSLGATAAALALFDHLPADRTVLIAPPAEAPHFARALATALGLSPERTAGMLTQVQATVGVDLASLDVRRVAPWIRQPALIFHDVGDREVPFAHGRAIADAWPGARLLRLERLGHKRPLADPAVVRATVSFLAEGRAAATEVA